jgi:hypothetical protein
MHFVQIEYDHAFSPDGYKVITMKKGERVLMREEIYARICSGLRPRHKIIEHVSDNKLGDYNGYRKI